MKIKCIFLLWLLMSLKLSKSTKDIEHLECSSVTSSECIAATQFKRKDIRNSTEETLNINKGKY